MATPNVTYDEMGAGSPEEIVRAVAASRARARLRFRMLFVLTWLIVVGGLVLAILSTGRIDGDFLGEWGPYILAGIPHHDHRLGLLDLLRDDLRASSAPSAACRGWRRSTPPRRSTCRSFGARRSSSRSSSSISALPEFGIVLPGASSPACSPSSFNYGAYMTEIFRAGIQAVPRGQVEAVGGAGHDRAPDHAPDRAAPGDPDRDPGHRQRLHLDDQGLGAGLLRRPPGAVLARADDRQRPLPELQHSDAGGPHVLGPDDRVLAVPGAAGEADGARARCGCDRDGCRTTCIRRAGRPHAARRGARRPRARLAEVLRGQPRPARRHDRGLPQGDDLPHRQVGVGQEHPAALHQLPRGADRGLDRGRRLPRRCRPAQRAQQGPPRADPPDPAAGPDGVPGVQPVPAPEGDRQPHRGARPREGRAAATRRSRPRRSTWPRSACPRSATSTRGGCPAARSSASRSRGR